jgi:MFS family permease
MTVRELSLINVSHLIDDGSVTRFQVLVIGLCSLVAFLDGLDSLSIAVAAPLIADSLGLAKSALGPIFSAALLGAMIGALTFGALGDRYGRKRILIAAVMVFAVFTFTTAHVTSYPTLLAARFAAGLGLGGATPCFIALASEYAPSRRRAMVASLIWAAFPLGGAIGGFLNAYILTHFGWQAIFLVGGSFACHGRALAMGPRIDRLPASEPCGPIAHRSDRRKDQAWASGWCIACRERSADHGHTLEASVCERSRDGHLTIVDTFLYLLRNARADRLLDAGAAAWTRHRAKSVVGGHRREQHGRADGHGECRMVD